MNTKLFYRVEGIDGHAGLWYDRDGTFTNRIKTIEPACINCDLPMPYDDQVLGYVSAVDDLADLYAWFSKEDLQAMLKYGFVLKIFESTDYKYYHNHWLIKIDSPVLYVTTSMESIKNNIQREEKIAELQDFAERQRVVYRDILEDPEEFQAILNGNETEVDWAFEELNTFLNMIDRL